MIFETNYGSDYGFGDDYIIQHGSSVAERSYLFSDCDLLIFPKVMPEDLAIMKKGRIIFGWCHCVQQKNITQISIDRLHTLIAWENMHHWSESGEKLLHIFYKNNEIAGYAAVLHSLHILGLDGHYGPRKKVVILSYGSVSRGAIYALQGRGFNNIHVFTQRPPFLVADQNPDVYYGQYFLGPENIMIIRDSEGMERPLIDELSKADIICNGVLQDTNNPIIFVSKGEINKLKPRSLIIDISCDENKGFSFARPTSFDNPVFKIGENITYYSVDHTPSYLWNAASREISKVVLAFLEIVASGPLSWQTNRTINKAIEIKDGVIQNPKILDFQNRNSKYPHEINQPNILSH